MTRPLRLEYEGALYHVTSRGNAREDIFLDDNEVWGLPLYISSYDLSNAQPLISSCTSITGSTGPCRDCLPRTYTMIPCEEFIEFVEFVGFVGFIE